MVTAVTGKEAKDWASEHLWGNCSSLYTPFCGLDGDEIDYEALRALVRHCLVELDQDGEPARQGGKRRGQAALGQDRRVDPGGDLA